MRNSNLKILSEAVTVSAAFWIVIMALMYFIPPRGF